MSENVMAHPNRELMVEAEHEREIADRPDAEALQAAIHKAVRAYSDFLERHGLIWGEEPDPRMKAEALVITLDYAKCDRFEIMLKGGAVDRVYANGVNPDPDGRGPPDIHRKHRVLN